MSIALSHKSIRIHEVIVDVEVGTEKRLKGPLVCGTYVQTHNFIPFTRQRA